MSRGARILLQLEGAVVLVGSIAAHMGCDRALGYGLNHPADFKVTHLVGSQGPVEVA